MSFYPPYPLCLLTIAVRGIPVAQVSHATPQYSVKLEDALLGLGLMLEFGSPRKALIEAALRYRMRMNPMGAQVMLMLIDLSNIEKMIGRTFVELSDDEEEWVEV